MNNVALEVLVCTLHARRWIFALRLRSGGSRVRPYNTQLAVTRWVTRLAERNGLVPGHDVHAKFQNSIEWIGPLSEPVVTRTLIVSFDAVFVGDLPYDFQKQVWRSQSMIQIGRDLKFPIVDLAGTYSTETPSEWYKRHDESYYPRKLRW